MRTIKILLDKEFRQIFRNRTILLVIFLVPAIQLILLPYAADYEIRNIKLAWVDQDHSSYSHLLLSKVTASGYFKLGKYTESYVRALQGMEQDDADIIVEVPYHFEYNLVKENETTLFFSANAIDGVKALLGVSYLQSIVRDLSDGIRTRWIERPKTPFQSTIDVRPLNWFNPLMNYQFFMVPGILVILVTIVGSFLTSINIVKEKEAGTIEQINVTPIKKYYFIVGKLLPFWLLGLLVLSLGLVIAWLLYRIVPAGNLLAIYVFASVYLLAVLGYGLLISTYAKTQQQAMLITFFLFMIFILLAGLYTPTESMPKWAQWFTRLNPVYYFIEVMRLVVLKGSSLSDIANHIFVVFLFAVFLNSWAVLSYKKRE